VRRAMFVVGVVPSVLLAGFGAALLWGAKVAALHTYMAVMMGWLLTETLLLRFPKLPFTCTYYPGTSKIGTLWPLYMFAFGTYTLTTAAFEEFLLKRFTMRPLVFFTVIVGGVILGLTVRRHFALRALEGFRFQEEDPEAIFSGFQLSESLAATPEESRRLG
jgi:hypothetical protein